MFDQVSGFTPVYFSGDVLKMHLISAILSMTKLRVIKNGRYLMTMDLLKVILPLCNKCILTLSLMIVNLCESINQLALVAHTSDDIDEIVDFKTITIQSTWK